MHRKLIAAAFAAAAVYASSAWSQDARLQTRQSPHDVATTVERIVSAVEKRGAKVVTRVDHAAAAKGAGLELRPTTVVIFGNPKLGTPLMQQDQRIGLDLPLRMLVWQDEAGSVQVGYPSPERMVETYGITGSPEVVKTIAGALAAISAEATAQ